MIVRRLALGCVAAWLVIGSAVLTPAAQESARPDDAARAPRNEAEFDAMFKQVSNWGRWGQTDQRGTMNLVTDAKRRDAARLVKTGIAVSLSHNYVTERVIDAPNPFEISQHGNRFSVDFHSTIHSHMDALCHQAYKGKTYNGHDAKAVESDSGCTEMGIEAFKQGVTTRGVLIDIPRLKGVPYLEPGTPVYPEDIEAWEKKAGVRIGAGDAILLRTGRWLRREKLGPWCLIPGACTDKNPVGAGEAGYHASVIPWLKQRDVAIIGADLSNDVFPSRVQGVPLPVHTLTIVALGAPIFDALDLEALADTAARLKRWEFMLTGAPLAAAHGTGSPINLIALF